MPSCSVIGCGARKSKNRPSLTLHRLPTHEQKQKKWLEAIGIKNFSTTVKEILICSLHFSEDSFNRTLDVIRLRDDAVPNKYQSPYTITNTAAIDKLHLSTILAGHDYLGSSNLMRDPLTIDLTGPHSPPPVPRTSIITTAAVSVPQKTATTHRVSASVPVPTAAPVPVPTSAPVPAVVPYNSANQILKNQIKIKKLQEQTVTYRKSIKRLHEKIRRQSKQMEAYRNIINGLMEKHEGTIKHYTLEKGKLYRIQTLNIEGLSIEQTGPRSPEGQTLSSSHIKRKKVLIRKRTLKSTVQTKSVHNRKIFTFSYGE